MVHWRTDRFAYFGGETALLEAWICNDLNTAPENAMIHYQLEMAGRVLFAQKAPAQIPLCSSQFQGTLALPLPQVAKREQAIVRIGLIDRTGKIIHDSSVVLTIFPADEAVTDVPVYVIGKMDGKAHRLARDLDLMVTDAIPAAFPDHARILIDDLKLYTEHQSQILDGVRRGGRAIFLDLPLGEFDLAGQPVSIVACDMNPRHFVSRQTGHPLVKDFQPDDFKFWFDEDAGYVTPLLPTTFQAEGWRAILTSGNGGWEGTWYPTLAAAEKPLGRGSLILCQLSLAGRVKTNPSARIFALRLLSRL